MTDEQDLAEFIARLVGRGRGMTEFVDPAEWRDFVNRRVNRGQRPATDAQIEAARSARNEFIQALHDNAIGMRMVQGRGTPYNQFYSLETGRIVGNDEVGEILGDALGL